MTPQQHAALREQHRISPYVAAFTDPVDDIECCIECGEDWPCTVIQLLDDIAALEQKRD